MAVGLSCCSSHEATEAGEPTGSKVRAEMGGNIPNSFLLLLFFVAVTPSFEVWIVDGASGECGDEGLVLFLILEDSWFSGSGLHPHFPAGDISKF